MSLGLFVLHGGFKGAVVMARPLGRLAHSPWTGYREKDLLQKVKQRLDLPRDVDAYCRHRLIFYQKFNSALLSPHDEKGTNVARTGVDGWSSCCESII